MGSERLSRLLALAAFLVGLYFLVPVNPDPPGGLALRTAAALVLLLCLAAGVANEVRSSARDDQRVDGLVGAIITVLTVFALGFYALAVHQPGEFTGLETRVDALYFSASTMLTIGYGDVHAAGQTARGLVLVQMVFDVIFVATAAGLLSARVRQAAADRAQREVQPRAAGADARLRRPRLRRRPR